jgi:hypothetical protein
MTGKAALPAAKPHIRNPSFASFAIEPPAEFAEAPGFYSIYNHGVETSTLVQSVSKAAHAPEYPLFHYKACRHRRQKLTTHRQDSAKHHGTFFGGGTVTVSRAIDNNGAERRYFQNKKSESRDFGTIGERGSSIVKTGYG